MLQTMAPSFIAFMCSRVITSRQPVVVTKMSPSLAACFMGITSSPSIAACRAQIGSTSVTMTRAPKPFMEPTEPLPTSPYPATTTVLPAVMMSVARLMPSRSDSRQP